MTNNHRRPTMLTIDDPFVAPARITRATFERVLREAGSPWAGQAAAIYDLIAGGGHDPAVWLAICAEEHGYGTNRDSVLWRNDTRSWTNARTVRAPALTGWEIVHDAIRGSSYVRYASVLDSVRDGMYRVTDPTYRYVQESRRSIGEVLAIWTEGDGWRYAASVVRRINGWIAQEQQAPYAGYIRGLADLRDRLDRRDPGDGVNAGPYERRGMSEKRGAVIHYSGPPVSSRADTPAVLRAEARYHVGKHWGRSGEPPLYGDGLMYHVAIGDDGTKYLCRDLESVLWHCGAWPQNATALSLHVPIGGDQRATTEQLRALREVVDDWRAATGTPPEAVWGHRELSATSCPGTLMADFVYPYRSGKETAVSDGHWFGETGHYIGGAFWTYWRDRGGLPIFGYPLTGELREDERTVQYFERAVFEWHPQNDDPYKVLLRRLGADALARKAGD
jgi:hypothetical protein